jgi:hypothetical protein
MNSHDTCPISRCKFAARSIVRRQCLFSHLMSLCLCPALIDGVYRISAKKRNIRHKFLSYDFDQALLASTQEELSV